MTQHGKFNRSIRVVCLHCNFGSILTPLECPWRARKNSNFTVTTSLTAVDLFLRPPLTDVSGERPLELEKKLVPFDSAVFFSKFGVMTQHIRHSLRHWGNKIHQLVEPLV